MATIERSVDTEWTGGLSDGEGIVSFLSGATGALPVTWASRVEDPAGRTSPEELLAASLASCFSMNLGHVLESDYARPQGLNVKATCRATKDEHGLKMDAIDLEVHGKVPGIDAAAFETAVAKAVETCPVGIVLAKGLEITHSATLEG